MMAITTKSSTSAKASRVCFLMIDISKILGETQRAHPPGPGPVRSVLPGGASCCANDKTRAVGAQARRLLEVLTLFSLRLRASA